MFGYAGKILEIDLSSRQSWEIPTEMYARDFLGGRGIATKLYWERVPAAISAFSPQNCIIFATGPLCGFMRLSGSRLFVCGKSPIRRRHFFSYANVGGSWGVWLKRTGYDALIVHGSSERPVYIFIREGEAEIRDAQHLWGKSVTEVCSIITKELGRGNKVLTIGQAGENLVSFATLCTDDGASGSGGLGSVMGSKKLKAIVLAGGKWRPEVALPEKLGKLVDQIFYLRGRHFAYRHKWEHEGKTKRRGCVGCISVCARQYYRLSDKKWVKFFCQMADVYEEAVISHYGKWNEVVVEATELSQEYGIDTFVLEPMIYWLKKCYHEGVIDEQKIRLPLSKIGTREFFEKLLKAISYKEDFGEILAEGTLKAAELLGENSQELIGDLIATEANDLSVYDPRLFIAHALLYALEPRKPISALHEMSMVVHEWEGLKGIGIQQNPGGDFLSGEDVLAIAEKFWGSADAGDFSTYKGKALAAIKIQNRTCVKESLGLCDFMWPLIFVRRQDHVGIPDLENQVLSAIRGEEVTSEELEKIGERVFNLQRLILLKEGWRGREDDSLRNAFFDIPLGSARFNPECLVPGPNGKPCSRRGAKIEKTSFETMKDEYYKLRGWSMRGVPLESKLTELFKHSVELCNTSLMLHSTL